VLRPLQSQVLPKIHIKSIWDNLNGGLQSGNQLQKPLLWADPLVIVVVLAYQGLSYWQDQTAMGKGIGSSPSKRIFPKVAVANFWHVDAVGSPCLDGAFFTKNSPKNHWQDRMVASKETEVLTRFWEVPEQLKKLEYQVQW
jgi:hypothetical protein